MSVSCAVGHIAEHIATCKRSTICSTSRVRFAAASTQNMVKKNELGPASSLHTGEYSMYHQNVTKTLIKFLFQCVIGNKNHTHYKNTFLFSWFTYWYMVLSSGSVQWNQLISITHAALRLRHFSVIPLVKKQMCVH